VRVEPATSLAGHIGVPGDKSISHRAVLIGAVCDGETVVEGFGRSGDTEATIAAVRSLGAEVLEEDVDRLVVRGVGLRGLREPEAAIDCANAGTLMRLLAGLLTAQDGRSFELTGDESLRSRPMERVAEPLRRMGADVETTDGRAPLVVRSAPLRGISYELPVASAQVKSAVLLAGLSAEGRTTVIERAPSRDHTELMLAAAGARVTRTAASVAVEPAQALSLDTVQVPGDFSSAAPFIVAATLLAGSELTIHGLGVNPRRTALLDVLDRMGARIAVYNRRRAGGEPVADVEVRSADLVATAIGPEEVPRLVDELPLFALAAGMAHGESVVTGAEELRHKETDRIDSVTNVLRTLGIHVQASHDGLRVRGVPTRPKGGGMESGGDHRIAMLGAVAGLASREGVEVGGAEAAAISFPGFFELLDSVRIR
jgi:3-phosphoshikimate 1-carboxyvinyltransferase